MDFDDGHCPTWSTQLIGLDNVVRAAKGDLSFIDENGKFRTVDVSKCAILKMRPRAWNMVERKMMVWYGMVLYLAFINRMANCILL